jgi:chorismate mutase / prephenate dehydratase
MKAKTICLGPSGSFSEEALTRVSKFFGVDSKDRVLVEENKDILPRLCKSETALAVSAMHTIAGGRVDESFGGLYSVLDSNHKLRVELALKMPIKFALLCRKGVSLNEVVGVISHSKGLDACSKVVREFPQSESSSSNSEAARMVAEDERYRDWAVIASLECAEIYGLQVLKKNISDSPAVTTFYAFSRGLSFSKLSSENWRLLSVFDLRHQPGSLFKVLGALKRYNLLHLDSEHKFRGEYRFVIEVEMPCEKTALKCAELIKARSKKSVTFVFPILKW